MSAKGRGRHEGGDFDYYPTPAWCVDRLLDRIGPKLFSHTTRALEPTAGDGAIVRAASAWCEKHDAPAPIWCAVEMRHGAIAEGTAVAERYEGIDFRTFKPRAPFDVSLGNPPYNLAESIIRHALSMCGVTAMLLRTGFLGSDERVDFWRTVGMNPALYVIPDRPSFDGQGTDSATYAWFVWGGEFSGVHMLDSTPLAVRNAQKPQGLTFEARQPSLFASGGGR